MNSPQEIRATDRERFGGKRVTVMGLGLFGGGVAAARFLAACGAQLTVTDLRPRATLARSLELLADTPFRATFGEHRAQDFEAADWVVVNPAVPPSASWLALARQAGARLTSEFSLFLERCPCPVALVTGTQGKSSTVTLLAALAAETGRRIHLGGNLGHPLLEEVQSMRPEDFAVVEVSSYQLEHLGRPGDPQSTHPGPRASAAAITNLLEDHLERHGSREAYRAAKLRMVELLPRGAPFVIEAHELELASDLEARGLRPILCASSQAAVAPYRIESGAFVGPRGVLAQLEDLRWSGQFQRHNALFALATIDALGFPISPARLRAASPPPHRMQRLPDVAGRAVWDNGVSTTPDSTVSALESLPQGLTLILGGQAKRLDCGELVRVARAREVNAVTFGASGPQFAEALTRAGVNCVETDSVSAAVAQALACTPPGGTLLFSPAAASFDAYPNFAARALDFRSALQSIPSI